MALKMKWQQHMTNKCLYGNLPKVKKSEDIDSIYQDIMNDILKNKYQS